MKLCIFTDYHIKDKECKNDFDCTDCEIFKTIEALVKSILLDKENDNQKIQEASS